MALNDQFWNRIKAEFSQMREVTPANTEAKRLHECIAALRPHINDEHRIDFTVHVFGSRKCSDCKINGCLSDMGKRVCRHRQCVLI